MNETLFYPSEVLSKGEGDIMPPKAKGVGQG